MFENTLRGLYKQASKKFSKIRNTEFMQTYNQIYEKTVTVLEKVGWKIRLGNRNTKLMHT